MLERPTPAGLYLHVPFCRSRCHYCGFYSTTELDLRSRFVEAALREAELWAQRGSFTRFDTLYLGGGTPTLLSQTLLRELLEGLLKTFSISPEAEITVEANPDDLAADWLEAARSLGVNRISLGAQSFDDDDLGFLNRRHRAKCTEKAFEVVRQAGFDNLALDLMWGLPGRDTKHWLRQLEAALKLAPEHLSCYQLTLEPDTELSRRVTLGAFELAGPELARDLFLSTGDLLADRGWEHYEVSNWARQPNLRSRHNQKYWQHLPYLGLGPAAHSFLHARSDQTGLDSESEGQARRWWNHYDLAAYLESLESSVLPIQEVEFLGHEQLRLEELLFGFRTSDGLALKLLHSFEAGEQMIAKLVEEGLGRIVCDRLLPTPQGFLLADGLPTNFFD